MKEPDLEGTKTTLMLGVRARGVPRLYKMEKTVEPSLPSSCGGLRAKIIGADAIIAKSDSAPMNQRDVGLFMC